MLWSRRQRQRRQQRGQWRHEAVVVLFFLTIVIGSLGGCGLLSKRDLPALEADARRKLQDGLFDDALTEAEKGYRESKHDQDWSWKFRTLKAEVLLRKGLPGRAISLLADEPPRNLPNDTIAHKKIVQGQALCSLDRVSEGEAVLHQSESLISPAEHIRQGELAFQRGLCAFDIDSASAQRYFDDAVKQSRGRDSFIASSALIGTGYLRFKAGRYGDAIRVLNDALSLTASRLLREKALGNVAYCYAELGDWRQSISFAENAEKLAAEIKNDGDREKWLIDLGRAHRTLFEFSKAAPYFADALAIAKRLNDADATWRSLNNLTQLALAQHDLQAAEEYWKEESALSFGDEGRAYVALDAASIAMERKEFTKAQQLLTTILDKKINDSLRLNTERELGNVYWQENETVKADEAFRKAIKDAETETQRIPAEHQMSFLDAQPFYDSYVRFLVGQHKPLEALKIAERGRAQILSQATRYGEGRRSTFSLETVQAALKTRNQIALAYSLTNEESFVWAITPTQLKVFTLPSHVMLHPQVDAFSAEVDQHRRIEESPAGQELYESLIGRVEMPLPKDSRIVIIPSKILSLVSFESLIVPGAVPGSKPHYWIDDVEIETASSLALLARPRAAIKSAKKKDLLLLGAPLEADKAFPFLPNASEEMNRVRSHFPGNQETVISGKDAVPQSYRASNPGEYRFIHIDAHSAASDLNPLRSFVVLSPTADHSYKLFADQITETPLHADLVTLSACYGAGTRWYNGEGIVGLGWAFLRAGAHQVVASLWTVDDASTPQLMDDFYGELSKGKSAAEALRAAKRKMLNSGGPRSRPFYWASLQLYTGS